MKKLIQLTVICVLAGFVISSCSSNLSITKRRYNKGFFVQHHKGVKSPENKTIAKAGEKKQSAPQQFAPAVLSQEVVANSPAATPAPVLTAKATTPQNYSKAEKKEMRNQAIELAVKHPVKAVKRVGDLTRQDSGDKALSLLWVVVVVILIVYLLGLLLDWSGGAGWIHILGIIALVLLILWLLRIL